jgi:hypothetical protein
MVVPMAPVNTASNGNYSVEYGMVRLPSNGVGNAQNQAPSFQQILAMQSQAQKGATLLPSLASIQNGDALNSLRGQMPLGNSLATMETSQYRRQPTAANATGANGQGALGTGPGFNLLRQGLNAGVIGFDQGVERQLYNYLGQALDKSPTMRADFIKELNAGNTYSFGYRTGGEPSFATLGTKNNRIEFNTQDLFQRAPYGPDEVAYHELYHSIKDVDHGAQHNAYIRNVLNESGATRVQLNNVG